MAMRPGSGTMAERERTSRRRCLVTRESRERERLLRFVLDPKRRLRLDLEQRLPGRGMWLSADRDVIHKAVTKNVFARASRGPVTIEGDLAGEVERLLVRRALDSLGLARRAGAVTIGFEKVRAALGGGAGAVLIAAVDGAAHGRDKLRRMAPDLPLVRAFTADELGAALGREHVVHAVVAPGRLARRVLFDVERLSGFRDGAIEWPAGPAGVAREFESRAATGRA